MKNFDEKLRDKLYEAEMPVTAGVWDAIEKNLDRKDKRPVIWLMLMMLLTGLPALYYGVYYQSVESSAQQNQSASWESSSEVMENSVYNSSMEDYTLTVPAAIRTYNSQSVRSYSVQKKQSLGFQIASGKKPRIPLQSGTAALGATRSAAMSSLSLLDRASSSSLSSEYKGFGDREEALFGTKMECPRFRQKWPVRYVFGQTRLDYPIQNLKAAAPELSVLLAERQATESALPSFGLEAGIGYDFYSGLFVQAGIAYNQVNIKFSHQQEDVINNKTSIVIDTLFNANGDIISITRDTTVIQEIGIKETVANNSFRILDVPVEIGYHYPISGKFNLRASVGMAFNLRTHSSGYMVDANNDPFRFGSNDSNYYKTRTGLSYLASLAIETKLSDKILFNAGIRLRYYGTEFNSSENPIDQTFTTVGLSAGLRYRI